MEFAIARAKEGNSDAVRYLYCRYADLIHRYVKSIVRDEYDAQDVTQTVFAKVLVKIRRYEPRGLPFSHWLMRVARNAALDHLRQRRLVPVADVRQSTRDAEHRDTAGKAAVLRDALADLPENQRRVVLLRHVAGLTPGEIADRIGATEAAVHGLHHRGRQALRMALVERGERPAVSAVH